MATMAERLSKFVGRSRTSQNQEENRSPNVPRNLPFAQTDYLQFHMHGERASAPPPEVIAILDQEASQKEEREKRRSSRQGRRSNLFAGLAGEGGLTPGASLGRRSLLGS